MIVHNMEQGTEEWFAVRCGIPTASCASKILTPTGKLSATAEKYINELLAERAGFGDEPTEPTEWMQRGVDLEQEARDFFMFDSGMTVHKAGFVTNDDGTAGCSPDGLITDITGNGHAAGWENKCPKASTHIGYLRDGKLPPYYAPQVHFSMAVTGLDRWVFQSYYPGLEPLIVPVKRDDYTEKVAAALDEFIDRLENEAARFGLERKAMEKAA